jgi:PAS domain S-box-containing protein
MGRPLRVLMVEDSEVDMILMVHELRRHGYDLTYARVETAEAMNAALDMQSWDIILSDYSMPGFSAPAALKLAQDKGIQIPFIIVSGTVGEEAAVAAMKAGAHDFFLKDKLARLVPAIERELREADDRRRRRWAEEQLRHSEERFAKAFLAGPMGITITAADGAFLDVNDSFLQFSGYSRAEVIGYTAIELDMWVDLAPRANILQAIGERETVRDRELRFRAKSGELRHGLCSFAAIELAGQVCVLSMVHDITERKRIEEERSGLLQQRQDATQKFLNTLERITDGFVMLDRQWRYTYVNPKAGEILGRNAEDLIGVNAWREFPEAVGGPYYDAFQEAIAAQTAIEVEAYFEPWNRWFVNRIYPTADGVTVFFQDTTESKQAEKQMLEAERMQVEIAKERELIQLKERFISVVSHEFRTPLSVIMSSAELVHRYFDRMPRERQLEHLHEVLAQTEFMVGLLDNVLTVNKARAGRLEFNPAPLDVTAFCQATLERMQAVDGGKHRFVFTHEGDLSGVKLDAKLLQHILVNLLSNAVKYSPDGGDVCLKVNCQDNAVVFHVSDQGIGIPAESLPQLYDAFFRANNTGNIGGTGLGMAIVKESVDLHQGSIQCESEVGVGTTFTVHLPAQ